MVAPRYLLDTDAWSATAAPRLVDGQIADIAAVNGLVLVTKNVRDYRHFRDLQVEDWSS